MSTVTVAPSTGITALPLRCLLCEHEHEAGPAAVCELCLGPLEPIYPERTLPDCSTIAARPRSIWRYREWLPFEGNPVHSLDTGFTPLIESPALARQLKVARVWIKNDSVSHPTLSFKDRVVSTAINAAAAFKLDTIGCA
jgi:threonine synthase